MTHNSSNITSNIVHPIVEKIYYLSSEVSSNIVHPIVEKIYYLSSEVSVVQKDELKYINKFENN
jgi:hypothetical protein